MDYLKVESLEDERVRIYNTRKEAQLIHMYEPEPGIYIAESERCIKRAVEAGHEMLSAFIEEGYNLKMTLPAAPVYMASHEVIKEVTGYNLTGGLLCAFRRPALNSIDEICAPKAGKAPRRLVILDHVENPTNIGIIFRNAAALNADAVLLTDGCSDPYYRRSIRTSMGTVFQIPWAHIPKNYDYLSKLKEYGFASCAMALTDKSVSINHPDLNAEKQLAIIMGNEGDGLDDSIIKACDYTVCIPMSHGVDSMNVAAASAVAIWELCK